MAAPPFDNTQEKERARLAHHLSEWIDADSHTIPSTEQGVVTHQALVAEYESLYGPISDTDRSHYAEIYQAIIRAEAAQ